MNIIAAALVCSLNTPVQECNNATADVYFPANCAWAGKCYPTEEFVYDEYDTPYTCFSETMAWVASQQKVGAGEYVVVKCGREARILNAYGTI